MIAKVEELQAKGLEPIAEGERGYNGYGITPVYHAAYADVLWNIYMTGSLDDAMGSAMLIRLKELDAKNYEEAWRAY